MAKTTSDKNYVTSRRPRTGDPIVPGSVVYDTSNRVISIDYYIGFNDDVETVTFSYSAEGYLTFKGVEYRNYQFNMWEATIIPNTVEVIPEDARFTYGFAYETTSLREYAPSEKLYNGNAALNTGASTMVVDYISGWMKVGETMLAMSVDVNDNVTVIQQFEITGIDQNTNTLSLNPAPPANYVGEVLLDGSIGDEVKVTNFEYGNAYEVTNIYTSFDIVNENDIIKKLR